MGVIKNDRNIMKKAFGLMLLMLASSVNHALAEIKDVHNILMHWTYKIEGKAADTNKTVFGTVFLMAIPVSNSTSQGMPVLVTAAHVLADIQSELATVNMRSELPDGSYKRRPYEIRIRDTNGVPLWVRHPEVDIAVMRFNVPKDALPSTPLLDTTFLAGDDVFAERDIHPGDELMCLGFPLSLESNEAGFPILRSGRIASYPVHPSRLAKSFYYDIAVYGGNSGGPVFFEYKNRRIPGEPFTKTVDVSAVAGIVIQDVSQIINIEGYFESVKRRDPLGLALVVPSEFIKQALELLK